ncbi:MAG: 50S ribosome-binding GTPase [Bifidobacteriaceae bacterium]|jgi:predicted GTPase|nr:50S ribosome-binding GTPase [Bifidobacteriaceae bacterium]
MTDQQVDGLRRGIERLRAADQLRAARLGESAGPDTAATAELLSQRLDRGVDHTIVALSGGTGSGKSSLFNAVAEMAFAEVGLVRPTTRQATACVWGTGAEELLDWLGVERGSWIKRDSVLESHIGELRGMILLDLPDYDSGSQANRSIADRALPLADVVVWVTDPQKYADPALHERFVPAAKAHPGRSAIVVLNQIDTVAEADAEAIAQALTALVVEGGLTDPVVVLTSAKTGAGVDGLRAALMERTARRTMAMSRTAADLASAARQLAEASQLTGPDGRVAVGREAEPGWLGRATADLVQSLMGAAIGAQGVAPPKLPEVGQIRQAASAWAAAAAHALPDLWALAATYALASAQNIQARLGAVLGAVEVPPPGGFWARLFRGAQIERRRRADLEAQVRAAIASVVELTVARPTKLVLEDRDHLAEMILEVMALAELATATPPGLGQPPPNPR